MDVSAEAPLAYATRCRGQALVALRGSAGAADREDRVGRARGRPGGRRRRAAAQCAASACGCRGMKQTVALHR